MKIASLKGVKNFVIENEPIPAISTDEVLIRVKACGVCTSELYSWNGKNKDIKFPQYLGHEPSGIIERVGKNVKGFEAGDHVTVWTEERGYAEYAKVPKDYVVKIPQDIPFEIALGEPIACAINGVRRSNIQLGDVVVIIGCGFMGSLIIQGAALRGPSIIIAVDLEDDRLKLAKNLGADVIINPKEKDAIEMVRELTDRKGADVVIEATGKQTPLDIASEMARIRGRLVIFGYHVNGPRVINMGLWNWKGLDVINAHERAPEIYMEGMRIGINLLTKGKIMMKPLVTHLYPLERINEAFNTADTKPKGFMKAVVTPQKSENVYYILPNLFTET